MYDMRNAYHAISACFYAWIKYIFIHIWIKLQSRDHGCLISTGNEVHIKHIYIPVYMQYDSTDCIWWCHWYCICTAHTICIELGGYGVDFSQASGNISGGVALVAKKNLEHGVTSFCPTLVTSPTSVYHQVSPDQSLTQFLSHSMNQDIILWSSQPACNVVMMSSFNPLVYIYIYIICWHTLIHLSSTYVSEWQHGMAEWQWVIVIYPQIVSAVKWKYGSLSHLFS